MSQDRERTWDMGAPQEEGSGEVVEVSTQALFVTGHSGEHGERNDKDKT